MKTFLSFLFLLLPLISFANEECTQCMSECPHLTREARSCDRGCPRVCTTVQVAEIKKAKTCEECLGECPHNSREFRSCDAGCVKECDRDAILTLFKKAKSENAACRAVPLASQAPAVR